MKLIDCLAIISLLLTVILHRRAYKQCLLDPSRAPLVYFVVLVSYGTSAMAIMAAICVRFSQQPL